MLKRSPPWLEYLVRRHWRNPDLMHLIRYC